MSPTIPPSNLPSGSPARWRRLKSLLRPSRFGGRITYSAEPSVPAVGQLVIGVIDDPDMSMRLLGVRGALTAVSIKALVDAFAETPDHALLHLDLMDVEFVNPAVIRHLGALLDGLEDRNVRIRIVGLGHLASVRLD